MAIVAFVDFYLERRHRLVEEAGYVPLTDEALEETRAAWEGR